MAVGGSKGGGVGGGGGGGGDQNTREGRAVSEEGDGDQGDDALVECGGPGEGSFGVRASGGRIHMAGGVPDPQE